MNYYRYRGSITNPRKRVSLGSRESCGSSRWPDELGSMWSRTSVLPNEILKREYLREMGDVPKLVSITEATQPPVQRNGMESTFCFASAAAGYINTIFGRAVHPSGRGGETSGILR